MKAYLETQYPRFTGLTGTPEQVEAAKSTFRVFAQRAADPDDPSGYAVPHSALSYLVGPDDDMSRISPIRSIATNSASDARTHHHP